MGREGANTVIDDAQATAQALQNTVNELLDAPDLPVIGLRQGVDARFRPARYALPFVGCQGPARPLTSP